MIDYVRLFWRDKTDFQRHISSSRNFEEMETVFEFHSGEIRYPYRVSFNSTSAALESTAVKRMIERFIRQMGLGRAFAEA